MSTLTLDFRHNYSKGERRSTLQSTYQWDLGHTLEIYVPENSGYEIHYYFEGATVTDDYAVESTTVVSDEDGGGYRLTAHVPNEYFESYGVLRLLVVGSSDDHVLTTYEGYITIHKRVQPEDYVDEDPTNGAETIIARAREYAKESEAWAVGTIDGEAVPSTADQYNNYAKYYAGQASDYVDALAGYLNNFATAEVSPAESAHSTGTYIVYGSQLYVVTADIAIGDTLAVGTNITAVTVNEVIEAVNASVLNAFADIATVESSSTASQAYAVGDYLIYNEQLYRVTAAIASGDTLTVGTNITAVTIGGELDTANDAIDNILGDFATVESSTTASQAYAVGEYLVLNNLLYKVTAAISSGGTITVGTNVEQTTVGDEIANRTLWFSAQAVASTSGSSGTLMTITDDRITADHVMVKFVPATANYIISAVSCTTSAGSAVITGTSTAATTAEVLLVKKDN